MSALSLVPFARIPHHIAEDDRIKPHDLAVIRAILRVGKASPEVHITDDAIARRSGMAKRTVQETLARLERCEFIQRLRGGFGVFRRQIRLLWMAEKAPEKQAALKGRDSARSALESAPVPRISAEEPEREPKDDDEVLPEYPARDPHPDVVPIVQATSEIAAQSGSSSSSDVSQIEPRKATRAELDAVVNRAEKLFGPDPDTRKRVRALARQSGLSWVARALDWAERKQAQSWGYVVNAVARMQAEGAVGTPPPPPKPRATAEYHQAPPERRQAIEAQYAEAKAAWQAHRREMAAEASPTKKTPDEVRAEFYRVIDARRRAKGEERL